MSAVEIYSLIVFLVLFAHIVALQVIGSVLFRQLKINHPKYYEKIGTPKSANYAWNRPADVSSGYRYMTSLVNNGVPQDFPDDQRIRKLASSVRRLGFTLVLTVVAFLVLFFVPAFQK
jgi:hypothetical protein